MFRILRATKSSVSSWEEDAPDFLALSHKLSILGGGGGDSLVKIDYNVLSVATMTLALIMMVEVLRHKLDHTAQHRPFFQAVLENIYAECESTIVSWLKCT